MTMEPKPDASSWKITDVLYGGLGFALGFAISFTITNSMQRQTVLGRTGSANPSQTAELPPDHPPIDAASTGASTTAGEPLPPDHPSLTDRTTNSSTAPMGAPPPLPSLDPSAEPGPKAENVFEDIQVLKGLPPIRVQRIMGIITVSLGVDCNYCHVPGSFDQPHPKKAITRTMFQMVKNINKNYVGGKVNCYTCHRGSPKPITQ